MTGIPPGAKIWPHKLASGRDVWQVAVPKGDGFRYSLGHQTWQDAADWAWGQVGGRDAPP